MSDARTPVVGGEAPSDLEMARAFGDVARTLLEQPSLASTLTTICELAVATIGGCDHAAVAVGAGRKRVTKAASDEVAQRVDTLQFEVGEGPCLDAAGEHGVSETSDLAREQRWPQFSQRAVDETGVHSVLSFDLVGEETMGALSLYSKRTGAFGQEAQGVGAVFSVHAAVAMSAAMDHEDLEAAVRSRDVIGQAKGILMARQHVSEEEAFDLLKRASHRLNIRLAEVARRIAGREAPGVE